MEYSSTPSTILKRWNHRVKVSCSPGFVLVAAALLYLDGQGVVLWGALCCVLHECGHWAALTLLGGRVRALRLTAVGAEMALDPACPLSGGRELVCALAGPAANLAAAAAAARSGAFLFAGINLGLGLFNLLPAKAMDGGRALNCLLGVCPPRAGEWTAEALNVITVGGLLGAGAAACLAWSNPTLLVTALWLTAGAVKSA